MSETQQSDGRSNVNQMSSAVEVQRRAVARQSPDSDARAAIPDKRSASGNPADVLFSEDGSLIPPEEAQKAVQEAGTVDVDDDAEAFLAEVAPEKLAEIDEKYSDIPGTRDDLIALHAEKIVKKAEERGEALHVGSGSLEFTIHQEETQDKWANVEESIGAGEDTLDECPKCGEEHVTASTVEIQTKGADESGTQLTKTSCGCTLRRTD